MRFKALLNECSLSFRSNDPLDRSSRLLKSIINYAAVLNNHLFKESLKSYTIISTENKQMQGFMAQFTRDIKTATDLK